PAKQKNGVGVSRVLAAADILTRSLRAEDSDRNCLSLREVIAVDARRDIVAQSDRFGALCEGPLGTRFDEREPAASVAEEISGAGAIGQQRRRPRHEDQTWLLVTRRRCPGSDA